MIPTKISKFEDAVVDGKPAPEVIIVTFVVVNFKIEILIDNFVSNA